MHNRASAFCRNKQSRVRERNCHCLITSSERDGGVYLVDVVTKRFGIHRRSRAQVVHEPTSDIEHEGRREAIGDGSKEAETHQAHVHSICVHEYGAHRRPPLLLLRHLLLLLLLRHSALSLISHFCFPNFLSGTTSGKKILR